MLIRSGAVSRTLDAGAEVAPALRKATRNMRFALEALGRAFKQAPELGRLAREDVSLVVGTNSGELDTSSEFLLTMENTGLARPLLFQNSLHNSTAGFLSIHFGVKGPLFTVSNGLATPGEAVELARLLLSEGQCRAAAVVLVESHQRMADLICSTRRPAEGAACLVFSGEGAEGTARALPCRVEEIAADYESHTDFMPLIDISTCGFFRVALALQESSARSAPPAPSDERP